LLPRHRYQAIAVALAFGLGLFAGRAIASAEPPAASKDNASDLIDSEPPRVSAVKLAETLQSAATAGEREAAADQLLQMGPAVGYPLLSTALGDSEQIHGRSAVIAVLNRAQTVPPELLPGLLTGIAGIKDASDAGLIAILRRYPLAMLHSESRRLINDPERPVERRRAIMRAMVQTDGSIGTATVVAEFLDHSDAKFATEAVHQLGQLAAQRFKNVEAAREWWNRHRSLSDSQWWSAVAGKRLDQLQNARKRNTELMAKLVNAHREFYLAADEEERATRLVNLLNDPMLELRLLGFDLIDAMVIDQKEVPVPVREELLRRLGDDQKNVRTRAATLIGNLRIKQALPVLLDAMASEESLKCRNAIINALGRLDDPAAVAPLLDYVASDPDGSLSAAISALSQLARRGNLEDEATQAVVDAIIATYSGVNDAPVSTQLALLEAMARIASPTFRPLLLEATEPSFDEAVRVQAIAALVNLDGEPTLERLRALLQDSHQAVRAAAITGLGRIAATEGDFARLARRTDPTVEDNALLQDSAWAAAKSIFERLPVDGQLALTTTYEAHDDVITRTRRIGLIRLLKAQRASMQALSNAQKFQLTMYLAELLLAKNDASAALDAYLEAANLIEDGNTGAAAEIDTQIIGLAFATDRPMDAMEHLFRIQGNQTSNLVPRADAILTNLIPRLLETVDSINDTETFFAIEKAVATLQTLASSIDGGIPALKDLDNRINSRRSVIIKGLIEDAASIEELSKPLANFDQRYVLLEVHQLLSEIYLTGNPEATSLPARNEALLVALARQLKPDWAGYADDASEKEKQAAIDALITP